MKTIKINGCTIYYTVNDGQVRIEKTENDNEIGSSLTLDKIKGLPVTSIGYGFLYYNTSLKEINLPNATSIGNDFLDDNKNVVINNGTIINNDAIPVFVKSKKTVQDFTIYKGNVSKKDGEETFVAVKGKYSAHGETIEKAIEDCNFKFLQKTINVEEYVKEVKEKGVMTILDYRLLTGACEQGCLMFLERNGLKGKTELPLKKALTLVSGAYNFDKVKHLF